MSQEGMKHALSTQMIGGVMLTDKSTLVRTVNLNLAAIRVLKGEDVKQTKALQRYILGLSLVAAMDEADLNLREGCNLQEDNEKEPTKKLVYRGKPPEGLSYEFNDKFEQVAIFAEKAKEAFFELAAIKADKIDRKDVIFETGVAEDYLGRSKADRKKINLLGPITKVTMTRFDTQGKDPFKSVTDELREVKKSIGRKPPKSKPRTVNIEAFKNVCSLLKEMCENKTLPDGVPEVAEELAQVAQQHEDSHEAYKQIDDRIKECKKQLKESGEISTSTASSQESK